MEKDEIKVIAKVSSPFFEKFGIPRQSGLAESVESKIVFEKEFSVPEAFRGIEGFSHLWVIWKFSEVKEHSFSPTVRPPKLGGNKRMGVFATRSPFRPNNLALSSVKFLRLEREKDGRISLVVTGADLMNGTPVYDVKPYLPYADSHPQAVGGFSDGVSKEKLNVVFEAEFPPSFPEKLKAGLSESLSFDPRPGYQHGCGRIYYMIFSDYEIAFVVDGKTLTVKGITEKISR
ncbi:MAG: tRNA (N6-threonylcarbamoyladenosine(37)-N6)-methyltransferase TrmO [Clostridia bacterium]|nr:tRNA (N6-threonylcarbamoyladenosine(37)-N6)-methyltransferase TrmO [Clostridia bacterium]